jgi:hypothetical protein
MLTISIEWQNTFSDNHITFDEDLPLAQPGYTRLPCNPEQPSPPDLISLEIPELMEATVWAIFALEDYKCQFHSFDHLISPFLMAKPEYTSHMMAAHR